MGISLPLDNVTNTAKELDKQVFNLGGKGLGVLIPE